jgi:hypothetical protein
MSRTADAESASLARVRAAAAAAVSRSNPCASTRAPAPPPTPPAPVAARSTGSSVLRSRVVEGEGLLDRLLALAHPLVAGGEDQIRKGLPQPACGEGREARVERLVDLRDGARREGVAAELLGDRLDLRGETSCTYRYLERAWSRSGRRDPAAPAARA